MCVVLRAMMFVRVLEMSLFNPPIVVTYGGADLKANAPISVRALGARAMK